MSTGIIAAIKNIAPSLLYVAWVFLCLFCLSGRVKGGILFLVASLPLQNVANKIQLFPLGAQYNDILIICILAGSIVSAAKLRQRLIQPSPFNPLFVLTIIFTYFTLWNGTFALNAPLPVSSLDPRVQTWKNYIIFFFLFWMVFNNLKTTREIRQFFWILVGTMFFMNYYTIDQIRWSSGLASREKFNGTFVWLGVNEVAGFYAAYTFVILGVFFLIKERIPKTVLGVLGALNTYVVLFLFSRGAYVAFFLSACFFSLLKKRWLLIPLFVIALFWRTYLPNEVVQRIEHTQSEYGTLDGSSARRIVMWEQSFELFKASPIFGSGYNIFPYLGFGLGDTHNIYIKFLAEQGIIGTALFLLVLFFAFRSGWRLYRRAKNSFLKGMGLGFMACIVSLLVSNMFGDRWSYLQVGAFFWVYLAMVERGLLIEREETGKEEVKRRDKEPSSDNNEANINSVKKPKIKMWNVRRGEA